MKKLLSVTVILLFFYTANATQYFFSNVGSDANNGTSTTTPWQTIAKFNSVFASRAAGDQFLFRRGDIYYGQMIISRSGSAGLPMVIGAYGTGAMPIITGLTNATAWTNLGSNIWETTSGVSTLNTCNMVVINGINTPMGRTPNTGWWTYTASTVSSLTDATDLNSGTIDWTGAELVSRRIHWEIMRYKITSASGGTVNYTSTANQSSYAGIAGYGFFIQNDARTLDVQNEWYYNPSTKKLRIFSTSMPTNVQLATVDTLVIVKQKSYITFDHIDFEGSNNDAFTISSDHVALQNCRINYSGKDAVWGAQNIASGQGFFMDSDTLLNTNNNAINLASLFTAPLIQNNVIKNVGIIVGASADGTSYSQDRVAITTTCDNATIQNNEIDSVGHGGIYFYNNGTLVQNNYINTGNLVTDDGALIYSWVGANNTPFTGQKVLHNIVLNGVGNNSGTTDTGIPVSHGIYCDDVTSGIEVAGNVSANNSYSGQYLHNSNTDNIHDNIYFNNGAYQLLASSQDASNPIRNITMKHNLFVAKASTQLAADFDSRTTDIPSYFTVSDSNYYTRPIADNSTIETDVPATTTRTLASWQTYSSQDAHSNKSPMTITTTSDIILVYNWSPSSNPIALDSKYIDMYDTAYNSGTITLAPYSGAVLIRTGPLDSAPTNNYSPYWITPYNRYLK